MPLRLFFGLWQCIKGHLSSPSWWPFQPYILSLLPHKPHCFMSQGAAVSLEALLHDALHSNSFPSFPSSLMLLFSCKVFGDPITPVPASHDSRHLAPLVLISLVASNNLHFSLSVRYELPEGHSCILSDFLQCFVEGACFSVFVIF